MTIQHGDLMSGHSAHKKMHVIQRDVLWRQGSTPAPPLLPCNGASLTAPVTSSPLPVFPPWRCHSDTLGMDQLNIFRGFPQHLASTP